MLWTGFLILGLSMQVICTLAKKKKNYHRITFRLNYTIVQELFKMPLKHCKSHLNSTMMFISEAIRRYVNNITAQSRHSRQNHTFYALLLDKSSKQTISSRYRGLLNLKLSCQQIKTHKTIQNMRKN